MNTVEAASPVATIPENSQRFRELDSMRGLAALVVLLGHFTLMFYPALRFPFTWKTAPLHPFLDGRASVIFFFLLSGFVLTLPYLRGKALSYKLFVWRRVLRIYGPYVVALVLAVGACALWHGQVKGLWAVWTTPVTVKSVADHVAFIGDYDFHRYNPVFWSLVHEMRISLIFPILMILVGRLKTWKTLCLGVVLSTVGLHPSAPKFFETFEYISVFLVGILLATNLAAISKWYKAITGWRKVLLLLSACVLYGWGTQIVEVGPLWHLGVMPIVAGAVVLLVASLNSPGASRILKSPIPTFLGKISYSLYLVHATVLFAMVALLKTRINPIAYFLLFLPTAILLSWGFYLAVEKPFTEASRRVGRVKRLLPRSIPTEVA